MGTTQNANITAGSAALPVGQPNLNQSPKSIPELDITLDPWTQDIFGDKFFDWDPDVGSTMSNEQHGTSIPNGWAECFRNEEVSSTDPQTNYSPAELQLVNFDLVKDEGQLINYTEIDLDQFFEPGPYNSIAPAISNDAVTLKPEHQTTGITNLSAHTSRSDYQMPSLPSQPLPFGPQRPLGGMTQLPPRTIDPMLATMGPQPFNRDSAHQPSRPIHSGPGEIGRSCYGYRELRPIHLMPGGIGRLFYEYGQPPSHQVKQTPIRIKQPSYGVLQLPTKMQETRHAKSKNNAGEPTGPIRLEWQSIRGFQPKNNRPANIEQFDPTKFYTPLTEIPPSFGEHKEGDLLFRYNQFGELLTKHKFSAAQIYQYLARHPLHYSTSTFDPKNSKLILWIQNVPADSSKRYPRGGSDKCRFANCPAPNNTIFKGFFRVAFDEQSTRRPHVDPFHCAGFVHLYCLERFCDFPRICRIFNVQPDVRKLPEGRNKMAITRDYDEMREVVNNFITSAASKPKALTYEETLGYLLTMKNLELEPENRKARRGRQNGNTIGAHLGNLVKWAAAGGCTGQGDSVEDDGGRKKHRLVPDEDVEIQVPKRLRPC